MPINFRSDAVTIPGTEIGEEMANSSVGDDVFGDDSTVVNSLEKFGTQMFGHEDGLFCISGIQTNQIAINVWTNPADEVICHEEGHIYGYKGGGIALNSMCSMRFLTGNLGRINPEEIKSNINPDDQYYSVSSLVSIEDTFLEAPIGLLLIRSSDFIKKARWVWKRGGGRRQVGIIVARACYALKNNIVRLVKDHRTAKGVQQILAKKSWIKEVAPVQTNIIVGLLGDGVKGLEILEKIKNNDTPCVAFGNGQIRFSTYLDITDQDISLRHQNLLNEV